MDANIIGILITSGFICINLLITLFLLREVRILAQRQDMVWQELVEIKTMVSNTHQIMLQLYRFLGLTNSGNKGT